MNVFVKQVNSVFNTQQFGEPTCGFFGVAQCRKQNEWLFKKPQDGQNTNMQF